MRLISQVANEIWICDKQTVQPYQGDISSFKMTMRIQMGIDDIGKGALRGDASQSAKELSNTRKNERKVVKNPVELVKPQVSLQPKPQASALIHDTTKPVPLKKSSSDAWGNDDEVLDATNIRGTNQLVPGKKTSSDAWGSDDEGNNHLSVNSLSKNLANRSVAAERYLPPHLRNRNSS